MRQGSTLQKNMIKCHRKTFFQRGVKKKTLKNVADDLDKRREGLSIISSHYVNAPRTENNQIGTWGRNNNERSRMVRGSNIVAKSDRQSAKPACRCTIRFA